MGPARVVLSKFLSPDRPGHIRSRVRSIVVPGSAPSRRQPGASSGHVGSLVAAGVAHVDHPKKKESSTTWITDTSRSVRPTTTSCRPRSASIVADSSRGRDCRARDRGGRPPSPCRRRTPEAGRSEALPPDDGRGGYQALALRNSPLGGPFYPAKTDITPPNDLGPGKGTKVLIDLDRAWPTGQPIIVKFLNGQNDPWARQVQQKVRRDRTDLVRLRESVDAVRRQRSLSHDRQFPAILGPVRAAHGAGTFNCFLGTDCFKLKNQVQSMNLIFSAAMQQYPADFRESEFQRLVLHEFGHALGMIHEHQRPDRDVVFVQALFSYAQTNWGWNADIVRQQILQKEILKNLVGTVFDEESIMMYEYPQGIAFHQKERVLPNTPDLSSPFATKRNTKLTALDKVAAAVTYPKPGVALIGEDSLTLGADGGGPAHRGGAGGPVRFQHHRAGWLHGHRRWVHARPGRPHEPARRTRHAGESGQHLGRGRNHRPGRLSAQGEESRSK